MLNLGKINPYVKMLKICQFFKILSGFHNYQNICVKNRKQAEAEVVPSSSLVEVEVGVEVGVEVR